VRGTCGAYLVQGLGSLVGHEVRRGDLHSKDVVLQKGGQGRVIGDFVNRCGTKVGGESSVGRSEDGQGAGVREGLQDGGLIRLGHQLHKVAEVGGVAGVGGDGVGGSGRDEAEEGAGNCEGLGNKHHDLCKGEADEEIQT
jgi:hypothetical protein